MKINLQEIKENLTEEQIINIVTSLGAETYLDKGSYLIFPTICHNAKDQEASMKLYYYKDSHMFHCYTECAENFDIFELIKRVKTVNNEEFNFYNTIIKIADATSFDFFKENSNKNYISISKDYENNKEIVLKNFDPKVLNVFLNEIVIEWQQEHITKKSQRKFHFGYYMSQNKVSIPHYDINGNLIGIRGRALEQEEVDLYGKYAPLKVENILYNHPLSFNLYGIYENKRDIKNYRTAIIFEGEKSVLLFEEYFDYNIAVASCGSALNYHQIELLTKKLGVTEIILAYDKEFKDFASQEAEKYYDKLKNLCLKYSNYCNFSFLYDFNNLLGYKDSPIDKGPEIFTQLLKQKVKVRND